MASESKTKFDRLSIIRALDQLLWPLALTGARLLAKIPRRRNEEWVVVRPGGMGDLICMHLAMVRLGIDPQRFVWVIERRSLPWVGMMGFRYRLISAGLVRDIGRYRNVINSEQHYGASQIISIALAGRSRQVIAFSTVRGAGVATNIVPYSPVRGHEVDSFASLLCASHVPRDGSPDRCRSGEDRSGSDDASLVVALGGGHAESRQLSVEQWRDIVETWTRGRPFSLVSGPVEAPVAARLVEHFGDRATHVPGDFASNCNVIKGASRVLTMDGGLTHVATFFGTPTDTIFTSGQVDLWRPLAPGSRVFVDEGLACRPCTMFGHTPRCTVGYLCKSRIPGFVEPAP